VDCTAFAFRDVYQEDIDTDDPRRFECWDFYPNSDKPDWSGQYHWEWEGR